MAVFAKPVKRLARAAGVSLTRHPAPNTLERHLKDVIGQLRINCVLDVGAHEGAYARLLRDGVGFAGHIASFEPADRSYVRLVASRKGDQRWRGYRYALGREHRSGRLNLYGKSQLNSLLTPSLYGIGLFPALADAKATEVVEVRRLAEVFDEVTAAVAAPRVLLKVDTQGFDIQVLQGAGGVLDRIAAVQVEVPLKPIYEGMPSLTTMLEWLGGFGFELTGVFPVSRDRDHLRLVELDCVLCRAGLA
jgi:FkbM family methyltransferase